MRIREPVMVSMSNHGKNSGIFAIDYNNRRKAEQIMVKHVVMYRLKEEAEGGCKKDNARKVKRMMEALNGKIPGMIKLEVGIDYAMADTSSCIVLYSEFVDHSALSAYRTHPEMLKAAAFVKSVSSERRMVDYEV